MLYLNTYSTYYSHIRKIVQNKSITFYLHVHFEHLLENITKEQTTHTKKTKKKRGEQMKIFLFGNSVLDLKFKFRRFDSE